MCKHVYIRAMFICFVKHLKTIVLKSLKSFFTTLLWVFILTSSFLFHASLSFLLSPLGLLHLLVLSALVEILHHDTNKHVKYKEADDEKKGDEVEQHPRVVVRHRLGFDVAKMWFVFTRNQTRDRKQVENSSNVECNLWREAFICFKICYVYIPVDPQPQHLSHDTWCSPSRLWRRVQTVTLEPGREKKNTHKIKIKNLLHLDTHESTRNVGSVHLMLTCPRLSKLYLWWTHL